MVQRWNFKWTKKWAKKDQKVDKMKYGPKGTKYGLKWDQIILEKFDLE